MHLFRSLVDLFDVFRSEIRSIRLERSLITSNFYLEKLKKEYESLARDRSRVYDLLTRQKELNQELIALCRRQENALRARKELVDLTFSQN